MRTSVFVGAGALTLCMSITVPAFSQYTVTRLTDDAESENHPAWSPDGARVAYDSEAGLSILNLADGVKTVLYPIGDQPSWSADGSRIAFVRGDSHPYPFWFISSDGGDPARMLYVDDSISIWLMKWSSDEAYIAIVGWVGNHAHGVTLFPYPGLTSKVLTRSLDSSTFGWAPDSRTLVLADERSLWTTTIDDEGPNPLVDDALGAKYPAWSPDGTTIAFSDYDGIWTIAASGGSPEHIWIRDPDQSILPDLMTTWSPDSRRLIFNAYDGETFDLYSIDLDAPVPVRPTTWGRLKRSYE